jgi:hypothetical protein
VAGISNRHDPGPTGRKTPHPAGFSDSGPDHTNAHQHAHAGALLTDEGLNRIGPDPWWPQALAHGVLAYYFICRVIADEFGLSKDAAADA